MYLYRGGGRAGCETLGVDVAGHILGGGDDVHRYRCALLPTPHHIRQPTHHIRHACRSDEKDHDRCRSVKSQIEIIAVRLPCQPNTTCMTQTTNSICQPTSMHVLPTPNDIHGQTTKRHPSCTSVRHACQSDMSEKGSMRFTAIAVRPPCHPHPTSIINRHPSTDIR